MTMNISLALLLLLAIVRTSAATQDGFYELLGVARDADDRTIRKAFKRLAMTMHPDKNKDDPKAHDKFVRINRAYEVLKDGELRKKYDLHGEAGLDDNARQPGQQYQSWQFYRDNFGIYDNDEEIMTLNSAEFDQLVLQSGDKWFVNFYSPQCSHCHTLAPTWRELATELEGAVRIGAVNCGDEFFLCQTQGIFGYPALIWYPGALAYPGDRSKADLLRFAMHHLKPVVHTLTTDNYLKLSKTNEQPWIIDFCDVTEQHCLTEMNRNKLAAMLAGLANVGKIDCNKEELKLCTLLKRQEGVAIYDTLTKDATGDKIASLDAREIVAHAMNKLPGISSITPEEIKEFYADPSGDLKTILLALHRTDLEAEWKKLPSMLADMQINALDCSNYRDDCASLLYTSQFDALPAFMVLKSTGGQDIHYGKSKTAHDVAAFAKAAQGHSMRALDKDSLEKLVLSAELENGNVWLVDFFAPWCPPCQKLLPEVRKAAKTLATDPTLRVATIDCTIHLQACQSAGVNSYPTTIVYNNSQPHAFVGVHSAQELIEFIDEVRHPLVISLNDANFVDMVINRPAGALFLVDFYAPWCGPCQQLMPEWRKVAKLLAQRTTQENPILVGSVDCTQNQRTCQQQSISGYPTIRSFAPNQKGFSDYNSWFRDANNIRSWAAQWLPTKTPHLNNFDQFEDLLSSETAHVVDFYAPWCGHCNMFAPEYELVAEMLESRRVKAVKVNCDALPHVCRTANVRAYPTVRLYVGAIEEGMSQDAAGIDIRSQQAAAIVDFVVKHLTQRVNKRDEL